MKNSPRKLAVLAAIKNINQPLTLPDILKILGENFAERSVRRWLTEMVAEGLIEKTGQKRGTRYQFKSKPQLAKSHYFSFTTTAQQSIDYVNQPIFQRNPVPYHKEWLEEYIPNKTFYLSTEAREQLSARGKPTQADIPAGTYARKIYNRLLIDLSYNSSRLEGNTYSVLDTEKLLIEGISNPDKMDEERIMILNHKDAIHYLVNHAASMQPNFTDICTLHYLLSDSLLPSTQTGKIRDHTVKIDASTYLTLDQPLQIEKKLQTICNKVSTIQNPYEQSFFLLTHLAYLQAFTDVNKRTSRLSANIPLIKNNLYPLAFNDIEKRDYISAMLAIYELNDIRPLTELYVFSYLRTCQQYDSLIDMIGIDTTRAKFRKERRELVRSIINHCLVGEPLEKHLQEYTETVITPEYRDDFIEDVRDDLNQISTQHIGGLGISETDRQKWLNMRDNLLLNMQKNK